MVLNLCYDSLTMQAKWVRQELRLPPSVKTRIVKEADRVRRSQNSFIVTVLEEYFERQDAETPKILVPSQEETA